LWITLSAAVDHWFLPWEKKSKIMFCIIANE
jgi:hypothetical protein